VNNNYDTPSQPTGASRSTVKILSTVLNIVKQKLPEYMAKARPPAVSFTAKGDNRASLYRKYFVPVIQNVLGPKWQHEEYPSMGMTVFHWRPAMKQGVTEGATVTRIDSKPITDFGSSLKAYKHTDDWSQSGVDTGDDSYWKNKNLKTNTTKGLFAGDPRRTALYATGNAHETRYVEFTQNGQPIVYFDQKDLPAMRSRKTYLTVFDASDLASNQYIDQREVLVNLPDADMGQLPMHNIVPRLSGTPGVMRMPAPQLGEHNQEIYSGLGLDKKAIEELHSSGII
jgi:hypothetical protein